MLIFVETCIPISLMTTISTFPQDGHEWRFVCVGTLSPFMTGSFEREASALLVRADSPEQPMFQVCKVTTSWFPLLAPDTIWKNGRPIRIANTGKKHKLTLGKEYRSMQILPLNKLIGNMTSSYRKWEDLPCLFVATTGEKTIKQVIIPCGEVVRSFYALDSETSMRLFLDADTDYGLDQLCVLKESGLVDGVLQLKLRKRVHNEAVPIIALLVGSQNARNEVKHTMQNCITDWECQALAFIRARIPFENPVRLSGYGTLVNENTLFLSRIVYIDWRLPWKVELRRENPGGDIRNRDDNQSPPDIEPRESNEREPGDNNLRNDETPFAQMKNREKLFEQMAIKINQDFTLENRTRDDVKPGDRPNKIMTEAETDDEKLRGISTGEGDNRNPAESKPEGIDIVTETVEPQPTASELIDGLCEELEKLIPAAEILTGSISFPHKVGSSPWSRYVVERKNIRQRDLNTGSIGVDERNIVVCEIERRPTESGYRLYVLESERLEEQQLIEEFMDAIEPCKGIWDTSLASNFTARKYIHRELANLATIIVKDFNLST